MRLLERLGIMRRVAVQLLGDATHIDAGAAEPGRATLLGQHDPRTALGSHTRGAHATTAATDHEQVDIEIRHSLFQGCSTTTLTNAPGAGSAPPP